MTDWFQIYVDMTIFHPSLTTIIKNSTTQIPYKMYEVENLSTFTISIFVSTIVLLLMGIIFDEYGIFQKNSYYSIAIFSYIIALIITLFVKLSVENVSRLVNRRNIELLTLLTLIFVISSSVIFGQILNNYGIFVSLLFIFLSSIIYSFFLHL